MLTAHTNTREPHRLAARQTLPTRQEESNRLSLFLVITIFFLFNNEGQFILRSGEAQPVLARIPQQGRSNKGGTIRDARPLGPCPPPPRPPQAAVVKMFHKSTRSLVMGINIS